MANRLINEQSPYLLQHAHNPVNWYPWGDEAFARAAAEHKPVLVSIGYAACHWCHVMERESFEDADVAAYMNAHFVCVKVDREEHPDVDHMYMDAVQAIAGNGGWPLNVFVTPDRAPFFGGTYYPPRPAHNRPSWPQLLQRMNELWTQQPGEVELQAGQIITHLRQASARRPAAGEEEADMDTCRRIADNLLEQGDKLYGGFGGAPKFPGTMAISFLLEHYYFTDYEPALEHAMLSLDAMIGGGIYDQLCDGFSRYATDRAWLAPHFEKMLYDNALILSSLCDAYRLTNDYSYKLIIDATIQFLDREMKHPAGGYYCALDADSEGEEGKFYTWTWDEWIAALGENDEIAAMYFGIKKEGNWEGTNILHVAVSRPELAEELDIEEDEVVLAVNMAKEKLRAARALRKRPMTDDKCLLSWNALMNITLCKAAVVNSIEDASVADKYLEQATAHMEWMLAAFEQEDGLKHVWKNRVARIPAKLDDYAYLVQALLQLGSAIGDEKWVVKACALTEVIVREFSAEDGSFYFTPQGQEDIPVRKIDNYDGATPSANALMAQNLWQCGMCMGRQDWIARSGNMLRQITGMATRYSYSFGYWALLLQRKAKGATTIVCAGKGADEMREEMQENYIPQAFVLTSGKEISELPILENKFFEDKMHIFVCTEQACLSPATTVAEALYLAGQ